jgi:hypothetical protein
MIFYTPDEIMIKKSDKITEPIHGNLSIGFIGFRNV